jgi:predicted phosphatase
MIRYQDNPLYTEIRQVIQKYAERSPELLAGFSFAAVFDELTAADKALDLHDSIKAVIEQHPYREIMNLAELIGTLELIKQEMRDAVLEAVRQEIRLSN